MGGKGKRGGGRAIYLWLVIDDAVFMLFAYSKSSQEDLTLSQRKALARFVSSNIQETE